MMILMTPSRIAILLGVFALASCQTIKMPNLDVLKSPEFREEAANIPKSFPVPGEAPVRPKDVRSDKQWDQDARALQQLRDDYVPTAIDPDMSAQNTDARFQELKTKAQAYKQDDPEGGIETDFPEFTIQPRRN